jgi:hypothetical protein
MPAGDECISLLGWTNSGGSLEADLGYRIGDDLHPFGNQGAMLSCDPDFFYADFL